MESEHIDALIQVTIALDATAKLEYPDINGIGDRFMRLCSDSSKIISSVASGGPHVERLRLRLRSEWAISDDDGYIPIESVYYHLMRCSLQHEATMENHVSISNAEERGFRIEMLEDGRVSLSPSIAIGMMVAVVSAPVYAGMSDLPDIGMPISGRQVPVASLWGKRGVILEYIDVVSRLIH